MIEIIKNIIGAILVLWSVIQGITTLAMPFYVIRIYQKLEEIEKKIKI